VDRTTPDAADGEQPGQAYTDGGKVHGSVVRALGSRVMSGEIGPGEMLPREDDLALAYRISRTSVREAIKVLSAKGLVEARPRVGLRVRPRSDWNFLDPAVLSWHPDLTGDAALMRSLIEARRIIEPPAAGLAARRATAADLAAIEAAYLRMEDAIPADLAACRDADVAFHRAVIAASGNEVLSSLAGTIEAALRAVFLVTNRLMDRQSAALASHREVMERIRFRDEAGAVAEMNRLLDVAAEDLVPVSPDGGRRRKAEP
jgi:GntR family transcriptional regulator, galactonate operon transcriptional repressor